MLETLEEAKYRKHMPGQMQETHAWPNVGNIWIGTNPYLIKRGACPPFDYILLLAIPYIFMFWPCHIIKSFDNPYNKNIWQPV